MEGVGMVQEYEPTVVYLRPSRAFVLDCVNRT